MWANILFALLTLLPVASCLACLVLLPQPGWHKSLAAFLYSHFVLSVSLLCLFFSLSSVRVAVTRIWIIRQMCQVEMLKFPTTFQPFSSPLLPLPCMAEVGKRRALFPVWRNWSHDCQMIANEWQRMTANVTPGYVDAPLATATPCAPPAEDAMRKLPLSLMHR